MDEVDAGAVLVVVLGIGLAVAGLVVTLTGAACLGLPAWALMGMGSATSATILVTSAVFGVIGSLPGMAVSTLGFLLVGAIVYGRLSGRWRHRRWLAERED